jgi:hypothetical protein
MAIHIRRRELLVTLGGVAASPLAALAQQAATPVVGILAVAAPEEMRSVYAPCARAYARRAM